MDTFINQGINSGIVNYLKEKNNEPIDMTHYFEMQIIKMLVLIFGEINIINPYKARDEKSFKENLQIYGYSKIGVDNLLLAVSDYETWLNSPNGNKNSSFTKINNILMEMLLSRNMKKKLSQETLINFDEYFSLKNPKLNRINELISEDPKELINSWEEKQKTIYHNPIIFTEIKPSLLSKETYERYGINLQDLSDLSNAEINRINAEILKEENNSNPSGGHTKTKPWQLVLTSGSGFVDTIVLLSVMATEIMVGLLIAFYIARR